MMRTSVACALSAVLFSAVALKGSAQSAASPHHQCFIIHVHLNGKPVEDPQVVTIVTKQGNSELALEAGCFIVPSNLLSEERVDAFLAVPRSKVYLTAIPGWFLGGPWDVDLEDRKVGAFASLPKHARAREACAVTFHVGEPERGMLQTGCRRPVI